MTRGRKKDFTIPPTRALAQQRDYRARKAQYVSELEERCHRAEGENVQLRKELELARAGIPAAPAININPQTAQASLELMHSLSVASASLARFQQLAFTEASLQFPADHSTPCGNSTTGHRPPSFPLPSLPPPNPCFQMTSTSNAVPLGQWRKRSRLELPRLSTTSAGNSEGTPFPSRSTSEGSDCCGGILDCRDLVEDVDDRDGEEDGDGHTISMQRMSGMRSTSDNLKTPTQINATPST